MTEQPKSETREAEGPEQLLARARALVAEAVQNESDPRGRVAITAIDAALEALRSVERTSAVTAPASATMVPVTSERVAEDAGRIGFLSTVCHDLKDPLAAVVMGSSFLLRETKGAPEGDRTQRMVQAVHRAGSRMGTLLQNLTDFVHLSTGRRTFDLRENSLRPIVERALDKMRGAAETAGVRVVVDVAADLRVSCDADAIALALEHLLANAIRYSPHGSDVHVEALVSAAGGPNLIDLRVRDAGPGIAAERLPHVFDTYWNARQKARDGVGLGLGIVGAIAEAHGGSPVAGTSSHGASVGFTLRKI